MSDRKRPTSGPETTKSAAGKAPGFKEAQAQFEDIGSVPDLDGQKAVAALLGAIGDVLTAPSRNGLEDRFAAAADAASRHATRAHHGRLLAEGMTTAARQYLAGETVQLGHMADLFQLPMTPDRLRPLSDEHRKQYRQLVEHGQKVRHCLHAADLWAWVALTEEDQAFWGMYRALTDEREADRIAGQKERAQALARRELSNAGSSLIAMSGLLLSLPLVFGICADETKGDFIEELEITSIEIVPWLGEAASDEDLKKQFDAIRKALKAANVTPASKYLLGLKFSLSSFETSMERIRSRAANMFGASAKEVLALKAHVKFKVWKPGWCYDGYADETSVVYIPPPKSYPGLKGYGHPQIGSGWRPKDIARVQGLSKTSTEGATMDLHFRTYTGKQLNKQMKAYLGVKD